MDTDRLSGFWRSRRPLYGRMLVLLALQKPGQHNVFAVTRPNTGKAQHGHGTCTGTGTAEHLRYWRRQTQAHASRTPRVAGAGKGTGGGRRFAGKGVGD